MASLSLHFTFTFTSQLGGRRSIAWEGLRTVRARLAHGWLGHSTCKTSPFLAWNVFKNENLNFCENLLIRLEILNKKNLKYLNFGENLKIWLEILNKKKLKFWLQTTTWNRLLLEPFLKNHIPIRNFFFVGEHSNLSRILNP